MEKRMQSSYKRRSISLSPSIPTAWPIKCRSTNCYYSHPAAEPDELGYCFDFVSGKVSGMVKLA